MEEDVALVSTHGIPLLPSHLLNLPSTQPTVVSHAPQVAVKPEQMLSAPYSYPFALLLQLQGYQTSSGQHLHFLGVLPGHRWRGWLGVAGCDSPVAALSQ